MIIIEKNLTIADFTAENIVTTVSETLNKTVSIEQIELYTQFFETSETENKMLLEKITLSLEINVSEMLQLEILVDKIPFDKNSDDEIFEFIDEMIRNLKSE